MKREWGWGDMGSEERRDGKWGGERPVLLGGKPGREGKCSEKGMRVWRDGKWGGERRVLLGGKPGREGNCS